MPRVSTAAVRLWRLPLVAMTLLALVDALDAAVARGVLPVLQEDWGLSDLQLGLIPSVFVFVTVVATVPFGYVADRTDRPRLMGWTIVSWSALTLLSATAVNLLHLLVARAAMGIGQAVDDPASASYLADSYPPGLRGRVYAVQQVALFVGGGVGLALGGVIAETWGWRWAFALVGIPGLLVAPVVFRLRDPARPGRRLADSRSERSGPSEARVGPAARDLVAELRRIFAIPSMRYLLAGVAAVYFTLSGVSTWLAFFHERYSDMSAGEATAVTGGILVVGGLGGTAVGGWLSDRQLGRRPGGRISVVVWSGLTFCGLVLVSFVVGSVPVSLGLQLLGTAVIAGAGPGLLAAMVEIVPPESTGIATSALGVTSALFGTAAAPVVVGALSDATGSLVVAFYLAFIPAIAGLLVLFRARSSVEAEAAAAVLIGTDEAPPAT